MTADVHGPDQPNGANNELGSTASATKQRGSADAIARFFIIGGWCIAFLAACSGGKVHEKGSTGNAAQSAYTNDFMTNSPMENSADENGVEHHRPPLEH